MCILRKVRWELLSFHCTMRLMDHHHHDGTVNFWIMEVWVSFQYFWFFRWWNFWYIILLLLCNRISIVWALRKIQDQAIGTSTILRCIECKCKIEEVNIEKNLKPFPSWVFYRNRARNSNLCLYSLFYY